MKQKDTDTKNRLVGTRGGGLGMGEMFEDSQNRKYKVPGIR